MLPVYNSRVAKLFVVFSVILIGCGGRGAADDDGGVNGSGTDASALECITAADCTGAFQICVASNCIPATCEDNELTGNESDVDCGGDCPPCTEGQLCIGANDCMTLFCDGSAGDAVCRDCNTAEDCAGTPGSYCAGGLCVATRSQGEQCASSNECSTGYCADGVCCDTPCNGDCQTCGTGTCEFVADGQADDACENQGGCGLDGTCDGAGGCRFAGTGVSCPLTTCAGGQSGTGMCNGAGVCASTGGASCDPYICGGDTCLDSCGNDTQCVSGYYCSGITCTVKRPNGAACSPGQGNQCQSGNCVDGYCCNSACNGDCQSCSGAVTGGSNGQCTNIPASAGPQAECPAAAACPNGNCCGNTGTCNGAGACTQRPASTTCVAQTCFNSTQVSTRTCNGSGTCTPGHTVSCSPYRCNGTSCHNSCSSDAQCQIGNRCVSGSCVPDLCCAQFAGVRPPDCQIPVAFMAALCDPF